MLAALKIAEIGLNRPDNTVLYKKNKCSLNIKRLIIILINIKNVCTKANPKPNFIILYKQFDDL